jgi:septal ring factor EnvC (AmiA/AmiB activator)
MDDDQAHSAQREASTGGDEGLRGRLSSRSEEALGEIAQVLLENPLLNQALQAAFGARDLATSATSQAMKNLNMGSADEIERLTRRLRSISDRLEEVEDQLDDLSGELAALRRNQGEADTTVPVDQVRLGLSE